MESIASFRYPIGNLWLHCQAYRANTTKVFKLRNIFTLPSFNVNMIPIMLSPCINLKRPLFFSLEALDLVQAFSLALLGYSQARLQCFNQIGQLFLGCLLDAELVALNELLSSLETEARLLVELGLQ